MPRSEVATCATLATADTRRRVSRSIDTGRLDGRAARAEVTDDWLRGLWRSAVSAVPGREPATGAGIALAAVGSHARREAGPHSDLDLVLLVADDGSDDQHSRTSGTEPESDVDRVAGLADRLWYPIWDAGRKLDHSVRSVDQCRGVAAQDLPALVGLLDLRLIDGDAGLVETARSLVARDWRGAARGRLEEVVASVRVRHARFGELAAMTEPDLKECRGGIRDMAVLRAMTAAWLADRPHGEVDAAYRVLLDVRDAVHEVTGRGRDRLVRQDVPAVADLLGLPGPADVMAALAAASQVMSRALETTVRRAEQAQRARRPRGNAIRGPRLTSLGFGVYRHDDEIVVGGKPARTGDPLLGLRAAVAAAGSGRALSPATVQTLAAHPVPPAPWDAPARELFGELLATGPNLVPVWATLVSAGVVERWLPCWASVHGVPQVSAIHRHTVDRHQLEVVAQCAPLLRDVGRPDLLLVAALLHDIGKPGERPVDHAERGAPIAVTAAAGLGFDDRDAETIGLLVRGHLRLAELATTRDPLDPATVEELLVAVDSRPEVLELLRALTTADARAVGGPAWSSARRAAIEALADTARRLLARRAPPPQPLAKPPHPPEGIRAAVARDGPQVRVDPGVGRRCPGDPVVLNTFAADRLGLFADLAALLAAAGLRVRSAELATTRGLAHDRWEVLPTDGGPPDGTALTRRLRRLEAGDRAVLRGLTVPTVAIDRIDWLSALPEPPDGADAATLVQVRAADAPGLLYAVGTSLGRAGVDVRRAEIVTRAGRCLDTFALTTPAGAPLGPGERAAVERAFGVSG